MTDPDQALHDAIGPLLRDLFEGPADLRIRRLDRVIAAARAVMRFGREVAPLVAPGADREAVLRFVAGSLAPAVRELCGRAGLEPPRARVVTAAFALGLEAGAAEPDRPPDPAAAEESEALARFLEFAQDLEGRGLDRDGIRAGLERFARGEVGPDADPARRSARDARTRVAIDAILTAFFPPRPTAAGAGGTGAAAGSG